MRLKYFQAGGPMEAGGQPAQDPMAQLIEMAMQAVQANDPNLAMQVCQVLVQIAQQGAPQDGAPQGGAPEGEPVFRRGGRLSRRLRW